MMKVYFYGSKALVRVLAAGRTVWCVETGEGWQLGDDRSLNRARRIARRILADDYPQEHVTFYFISGEK